MSRIQDILSKAERDGTARRTRSLRDDEYGARPGPSSEEARGTDDISMRVFLETPARTMPQAAPRVPPPAETARITDAPRVRALRTDTASAVPYAPAGAPPETDARTSREPRNSAGRAAAPASHAVTAPSGGADGTAVQANPQIDQQLVAALAPTSLAAEQYRSLRTRLKQAERGRPLRTIAITSPAKGDGKSLTAANLALTMAQEYQQRVLLLDADLRRPTLHRLFGLSETPGLVDLLMNGAEIDEALVFLPDHHLTVLPAGIPPSHPAELLGSATMRGVLDALRTRFDRILIDVPPVSPLADLQVLAPVVDGVLMIVRAGVTPKPAIERALAEVDASKVVGLVLNEAGIAGRDADNYQGYGYIAG